MKKEYDSYLKTIGSIGNDTISYENPDSEKKLTEELGINIESENNGIIGFMDSHVFDKSDAAADKDEEKEGEGDDNKAEAQQKEGDAAPNKAEEKENNSRARNLKVFIDNMINSRNRNLKIGNIVCAHRRTEGYFINDSLKKIRGVIRDLLYEKNKDALGVVPNYIDICFDKYCPTHENCFAFDNEISKPIEDGKIDSVIFQQIYEYLFGQDNSYSIQQMYNDILVGVFCVINISKEANNPPPVPYVDINDLKRLVHFNSAEEILGSETDGKPTKGNKTDEFISLAKELINVIENKYIDEIDGGQKNKIEDIKSALSKIEDGYAFHTKIKGVEKDDLKSSFQIFKIVVFHLIANFNSKSGGSQVGGRDYTMAENIDIRDLFKLDLIRLYILKQWANVSKEDKTDTNIYATPLLNSEGNYRGQTQQDIDKYIEKNHRYFIDMYNKVFYPGYVTAVNQPRINKKDKDLMKKDHEKRTIEYEKMANSIRDKINKTKYKLKTNHDITFFEDPEDNKNVNKNNDNNKDTDENNVSAIKMIELAIQEIKGIIDNQNIEIEFSDTTGYTNGDKLNDIIANINNDVIENNSNKDDNKKGEAVLESDSGLKEKAGSDSEDTDSDNKVIQEANEILMEVEALLKDDDSNQSNNQTNKNLFASEQKKFNNLTEANLIEMIDKSKSVIDYIREFLEIVENSNAISMVGTLEFTDKIAKLNTVATICNEGTNEHLFENFNKKINMKPLYGQKPSSGGSLKKKRITKTSKTGSRKIKKA